MTTGGCVLELDEVSRRFGQGGPSFLAVDRVSLSVQSGEVVAITGPSGSGKSTLLNLAGLLDRPDSGRISICGRDTASLDEHDRNALRATRLGFVFQRHHLMDARNVLDNVVLGRLYDAGRPDRARCEADALDALGEVGMGWAAAHLPSQLSGGERQRVAIARALVGGSALLLCDEPTGQLDSGNGARVIELLGSLAAAGRAVVVVTHDPTVADAAHRTVHLRDGRVSAATRRSVAAPSPSVPVAAPADRLPHGRAAVVALVAAATGEAVASMLAKARRTTLLIVGVAICGAAVIALGGASSSAAAGVFARFDVLAGTTVSARLATTSGDVFAPAPIPAADVARVGSIRGVVAVAGLSVLADQPVRSHTVAGDAQQVPVVVVSDDGAAALGVRMAAGRFPVADGSVVAGPGAAAQLGLDRGDVGTSYLEVDGRLLHLTGIATALERRPDLEAAVFVAPSTDGTDGDAFDEVLVRTRIGAAGVVAHQLAQALDPFDPSSVDVSSASDPQGLRGSVASSLSGMQGAVAAIAAGLALSGIAGMITLSLGERRAELGLRRALGASRLGVAAQIVAESSLTGVVGGAAGVALGAGAVLVITAAKRWTPTIDLAWLWRAPVAGLVVGGLAGLFPAWSAASAAPSEALRDT